MSKPYTWCACYRCKEPVWFTLESYQTYKRNGKEWFCLHGHGQVFVAGKTDAEKLQEQLDAERRRRQSAEQNIAYWQDEAKREKHRANGYKGHATRITKRAKAGVCPCCNRHFVALERHMASKHPDFTPIEADAA